MHKPESIHKTLKDFKTQMNHQILTRRPDKVSISKKNIICHSVDFAIPVEYRVKMKENEKINKCLDLAGGLKKLWNMKVTEIPIVINALGMISKA